MRGRTSLVTRACAQKMAAVMDAFTRWYFKRVTSKLSKMGECTLRGCAPASAIFKTFGAKGETSLAGPLLRPSRRPPCTCSRDGLQ
jgi:hypothetical protein